MAPAPRLPPVPTASQTASFSLALYPPGLDNRISLSQKRNVSTRTEGRGNPSGSLKHCPGCRSAPPPQDLPLLPSCSRLGSRLEDASLAGGHRASASGHLGLVGEASGETPSFISRNFKMWGVATPNIGDEI